MRVFGLKSCDTCRRALQQIRAAGHVPQVIDLRDDGMSQSDLQLVLSRFGDAAINRASTTWRGLTDAERAQDTGTLLAAFPTLFKRPVIENAGVWTMGWAPAVQVQVL